MRDEEERERNKQVLGEWYFGAGMKGKKGREEGKGVDGFKEEGKGREKGRGKGKEKERGEKIRVYASKDLEGEGWGRDGGGKEGGRKDLVRRGRVGHV